MRVYLVEIGHCRADFANDNFFLPIHFEFESAAFIGQHAFKFAFQKLFVLAQIVLAQPLKASVHLPHIREAKGVIAKLQGAHCMVVRQCLHERTHFVQGSLVKFGGCIRQQLIISVIDLSIPKTDDTKVPQLLSDWTGVYNGLSDDEIESIDKIAKTRADLTRNLP